MSTGAALNTELADGYQGLRRCLIPHGITDNMAYTVEWEIQRGGKYYYYYYYYYYCAL
jgi:hypothetical protein